MRRSLPTALLALTLSCGASPRGVAPEISVVERYAVTADGVRLYYRIAGAGPETVLAPFALFHESALDPLARRGRRIVTYDPRGRGRSDSVPPEKVSLDNLLLDLETIRQAVGAERVALIGWSGGGMETFVYALRNPQRVTRLVQLAPVAPRFEPYGPLMMRDRAIRTDSAAKERLDRRVAAGEFRNDPAGLCRAQAAVMGPALFADPAHAPTTPDVCRYPNEYPERLGPYFQALFKSLDGFDWRDFLTAVTIPRLVIHGARDNTPLAGNQEWVAGQANARLQIIDGAGHWPQYEQPATTLRAIDEFLSGKWPSGATAVPVLSRPAGADRAADQLLDGARRAIGETGRVQSLSATAAVTGPSGTFQTIVHSARDGRARLDLGKHLLAGIGRVNGWLYHKAADSVARLDDTTRSVIRGHELHMLVLAPETRWGQPVMSPNSGAARLC